MHTPPEHDNTDFWTTDRSGQMSEDHSNGSSRASPAEPDPDTIKMFVGQIPRQWNEQDLRKLFEKYGPVYALNLLRDKQTQQSRGCCFVTYFHRKDAIAAQCALHNIEVIEGMHHAIQMKPADTENRNDRKLFIGQLSKKQAEDDLRQMFGRFGHIEDVSVLRDNDGRSRGCAFVTFATRTCAVNATKEMHHSQTMEGCTAPLVVKFADSQKEREYRHTTPKHPTPLMSQPIQPNPLMGYAPFQALGAQQGLNLQALSALAALIQPGQQNVLAALGNVALLQQHGQDPLGLQQHAQLAAQQLALQQHQQQQQEMAGYGYVGDFLGGAKKVSSVDSYLQQYALQNASLSAAAAVGHGHPAAIGNGETKGPEGSNLFIYHLPQDFGDNDLLNTFSPFGTVLSAKVFIDKVTNLSKCFGFISYDNAVSATNAIAAMNGFQIGSKRLKVQLKNERAPTSHPYAKA